MSRSGYTDDYGDDYPGQMDLYRAAVDRAIKGKRGQQFLRELAAAMDAMPEKVLIADALQDADGCFCALGVVGHARGLDLTKVDPEDAHAVSKMFNIAESMAREIVFTNDDDFDYSNVSETPEKRWQRVRRWVAEQLKEPAPVHKQAFSRSDADGGAQG